MYADEALLYWRTVTAICHALLQSDDTRCVMDLLDELDALVALTQHAALRARCVRALTEFRGTLGLTCASLA